METLVPTLRAHSLAYQPLRWARGYRVLCPAASTPAAPQLQPLGWFHHSAAIQVPGALIVPGRYRVMGL